MELTRPVSLLSTLWAAAHAKGIPSAQKHQGTHTLPRNGETSTDVDRSRAMLGSGRAGLFKSDLKQDTLRLGCAHKVPFLPHTLHFHTSFSTRSWCGHSCHSSLLWVSHFGYHTRLLLQARPPPSQPAANSLEQTNKTQRPSLACTSLNYNKNSSTSPLHCLPLPLSRTPEPHTTHHNQCLQSDPYKTRHT